AVDGLQRVRERTVRTPRAADAAGEIRLDRELAPLDAEADRRFPVAIGVLVEREAEPRNGYFVGMRARVERVHAPEPVEVALESAGAALVPPEPADRGALVVAREDAHQLAFAVAVLVDAERDARVVADVRKRNGGVGDGRRAVVLIRPGWR